MKERAIGGDVQVSDLENEVHVDNIGPLAAVSIVGQTLCEALLRSRKDSVFQWKTKPCSKQTFTVI